MDPNDEPEEDGANIDLDAHRKGKCAVIKTSTRQVCIQEWHFEKLLLLLTCTHSRSLSLPHTIQPSHDISYLKTIFLPMIGLVEAEKLKPGDLVGVNKDSYLILDTLPSEYDSRVKAMEVDEKPTEDYNDVGGLDKQIEELVEAIVLPMTHRERFINLGIKPPKGKGESRREGGGEDLRGGKMKYMEYRCGEERGVHTMNASIFIFNPSTTLDNRLSHVWTTGNGQDSVSSCLCCSNKLYIFETSWSTTRSGKSTNSNI